ncbi:MAG TPA: S41 family peptidase, partial [Firmicutes bacterium]|nr:S41 family peptidase [Candidatus Fermentithermobacillaceae bacterium]
SYTSGEGLGMPLVVLVNGGSASASEILAGAIQDREVGPLVGTTTFGKGLVQGAYTLEDGSVVKVTVAEYLTPNGRAINGVGLEPDFFVEGDEAQLDKAIELARAALQKGA